MISESAMLARFERVKKLQGDDWLVTCPSHEDRTPSLHVTLKDGQWLLHCLAACEKADVIAAAGLSWEDLSDSSRNGRREVEAYPYTDEQGRPVFEVVRFEPKDFRQRQPDGTWSLKGVRRVVYRLPAVLERARQGGTVYVVEGERDVHALERAGAVATCNPGGAGKWRHEYTQALAGADVIVVADRDEPGRKHARQVAASLEDVARSVRIVEAATGKDAADHLRAGRTLEDLRPVEAPNPSGWTLRNPDPSRAKPVTWAWEGRVPIGRLSLVVGNEGVGKGTVIAHLAARWSRGTLAGDLHGTPCDVLVVGDEDALDDTWTPRLHAAGVEWRRVWFPPADTAELDLTAPAHIAQLREAVRRHRARVVIFDALLDHLGGASVDEFKAKAVRNALRPIRRLAAEEGFAALGAMHPRKGRARVPGPDRQQPPVQRGQPVEPAARRAPR